MEVQQLPMSNALQQLGFQKNDGMMVNGHLSVSNAKTTLDIAGFAGEYMDVLHSRGNGLDPTRPLTKSETIIIQELCGPFNFNSTTCVKGKNWLPHS